ncbi:hypothetical protein AAG570_001070 [Ranatra chinensis]|uniref:Uncharacterized protein n=1 Tax=Ranatra chinensis TaxID=642074 RepID=A0ABD0YCN7_9HEMI
MASKRRNMFFQNKKQETTEISKDDGRSEPQPYEFGYAVKDHHTGTDFGQQEASDGHNVKGQYRVLLPDGRLQIVTYTADWKTGFHADVKYEGEAHYPSQQGQGYPASGYHQGGNNGYSTIGDEQAPAYHQGYTR